MTTNTKDRVKADELETYKGKWRNVWFNSKGCNAHIGHGIFDSAKDAEECAKRMLKNKLEIVAKHGAFYGKCADCGQVEFYDETAFAIQMPVSE